jgi:hypothetical protein
MELLTQEQHNKRKAVIRENNLRAQKELDKRKSAQTQSDQTERSNTQSSSDTQSPSEANTVSVEEAERIEAERKNLESAKDFQRIANLEHYKEKAEIENQTGVQPNLPIDSLPLAGSDERSNLNQT